MQIYKRGRTQIRGRIRWTMRRLAKSLRYGPSLLQNSPVVFGNAIPKCGSKLLFNVLRSLEQIGPFVDTGLNEIKPFFEGRPTSRAWINAQLDTLKPGDIRLGYLYAEPEVIRRLTQPHWASFFILRDPRDQIVSEIFYAVELHKGHALHDFLSTLPDMPSRIEVLIKGIERGPLTRVGVREHYARFRSWWQQPGICQMRFEEIIQDREGQVERILEHLSVKGFSLPNSRKVIVDSLLQAMLPDRSETFRKGESGSWKSHFSTQNIEDFKQHAGELLVELGYERDLDW